MNAITKILASIIPIGLIITFLLSFVIAPLEDFRNYIISQIFAKVLHLVGINIDPMGLYNFISSLGNFAVAVIPLIIVSAIVGSLIMFLKKII